MEIETLLAAVATQANNVGGWDTAPTVHWWPDFERKELRDPARGLSALIVPAEGQTRRISRSASRWMGETLVDVAVVAPLTATDDAAKQDQAAAVVGQAEGIAERLLGAVLTDEETGNQAACQGAEMPTVIDADLARRGRLLVSILRLKFATVRQG